MDKDALAGPVAHILVVGFHHRKGCQVEFSHPPIFEEEGSDCKDLPPQWKHLPCLALPDGSHNYDKDTIYFLLPGRDETKSTMFGISCYKQMRANDLIRKSSEVTRGTVQKSVVVLSELPLFGLIDVKLQLITHAYFAERDFSKISVLEEFFNSMKTSLPRSMSDAGESQVFVGLSLVDLVKKFRHKTLIIFKLLLLERRVLFFGSPVRSLCSCLLSVISLYPEILQRGLTDAACPRSYQVKTPTVSLEEFGIKTDDYFNVEMSNLPNYHHQRSSDADKSQTLPSDQRENSETEQQEDGRNRCSEGDRGQRLSRSHSCDSAIKSKDESSQGGERIEDPAAKSDLHDEEDELLDMIDEELFGTFFDEKRDKLSRSLSQPDRTEVRGDPVERPTIDREDGARSPNEMSSLLSHDMDSRDEQAGVVVMENKHELKQMVMTDGGTITANNNQLCNSGRLQSSDPQEPADEKILGSREDTEEEGRGSRMEEVSLTDDATQQGTGSINGKGTPESGVSSLGSPRWEGDPSPQKIDRITGGDPRSSLSKFIVVPEPLTTPDLAVDDFGFPLSLFGMGSLFHPYMALQQHDLLTDASVRCFVVGASNVLFKHKRQILDVIVEIESGEVTILNHNLRKQLSLTTADLRFSDYVVNTVLEHNGEDGMGNTGWEGGEEWIRAQFKLYLLSLLATCADSRPLAEQTLGDFNESYVAAWRVTHNYRVWKSREYSGIDHVHTRHLCHGQLSMNDMKIRWNSAMQNSERGKNLNNVINRTGLAMSHTGKVVGEALTSAKSVMSTWLFGFGGADDDEDSWSYEQE